MKRIETRERGRRRFLRNPVVLAAIGALLAGSVVASAVAAIGGPSPFSFVYERLAPGREQPPNALTSEQAVTKGDTTIRLLRVTPSSSGTLVELAIEDPVFAQTADINSLLPLRLGVNVRLSGFAEGDMGQSSTLADGAKRVLLDMPPLLSFDGPATIEIADLKKKATAAGSYEVLPGPWCFTFTPEVPLDQRLVTRFKVAQVVEADGVTVTAEEVQLSSTETVLRYRLKDVSGVAKEEIDPLTLHYGESALTGHVRLGAEPGSFLVQFPALPRDVKQFRISLPRTFREVREHAQVTVNLPQPVGTIHGRVSLDQTVTVKGHSFRFTSLVLTPTNFELRYEPADPESRSHLLFGPGPVSRILATDDRGNTYVNEGREIRWTEGELDWSSVVFIGTLPTGISKVVLDIDGLGQIVEAPPPFIISIPD